MNVPLPSNFEREIEGNLVDLLARWRLTDANWSILSSRGGRSGAQVFSLTRRDGERFVLKLTCSRSDWVMAVTEDWDHREARSAMPLSQRRLKCRTVVLGAAIQGAFAWTLMEDISTALEAALAPSAVALETIIHGITDLYREPIDSLQNIPLCSPERRLLLMTPGSINIVRSAGHPDVANLIESGWQAFFVHAPEYVAQAVLTLMNQRSALIDIVSRFKPAILHGDLKLENIGLDSSGVILIDWALVMCSAPGIDIGWFIAANSEKIGDDHENVLTMFAGCRSLRANDWRDERDLAIVAGLLLRGWKKALDFQEGRSREFLWWVKEFEASMRRILS